LEGLLKRVLAGLTISAASAALGAVAYAAEIPSWAYPLNPPGGGATQAASDDKTLYEVPDSAVKLTKAQIGGRPVVPDWHPGDHPAMPDIVAKGRGNDVRACGFCHQPSGVGRPENAALAGLTPEYIRDQVLAFRNGERQGSEPKRTPQNLMIALAKGVTDAEITQAAVYFSELKPKSFVKVVEAATVPKTTVAGGMVVKAHEGGMEPIGNRMIEVPDDFERAENRDPRTTYTAYVPPGTLAKGRALVTTGGNGKTIACGICHGPDLKGVGDIPMIAGRSPSYIIRQLYDIQNGTRSGSDTALMKQVVAKMTTEDMIAVAAYAASQQP
jgi:cytochrome c553